MAFTVSTRDGDFLKAFPHLLLQSASKEVCHKLFGAASETMNIYSHRAKGRAVWWHENYKLLMDSLGICFYLGLSLLPQGRLFPKELGDAYAAATGFNVTGKELMYAAERSNQIERAINSMRGLDRKDDTFIKRPEQDSWAQGINLDQPGMLDEYYAYRGLSPRGFPTKERLLNSDLPDLVSELANAKLIEPCLDPKGSLKLDKIIKNPSADDIKSSLRAKVQNRIKKRIMERLSDDPIKYREYFKRIGAKKRKQSS